MRHYQVDAVLRDERGQELRRMRGVWQGEAADPAEALRASDDVVREHVEADARISAIGLQVRGQGGLELSTTEYPEDYLAGRGTSADSSALVRDSVDPGLTPEQYAEAERVRAARALALLPPEMRTAKPGEDLLFDGLDSREYAVVLDEAANEFLGNKRGAADAGTFQGVADTGRSARAGASDDPGPAAGGVVEYPDSYTWERTDGALETTYGNALPSAGSRLIGVTKDGQFRVWPAETAGYTPYVWAEAEDDSLREAGKVWETRAAEVRRAYAHGLPGGYGQNPLTGEVSKKKCEWDFPGGQTLKVTVDEAAARRMRREDYKAHHDVLRRYAEEFWKQTPQKEIDS